MKNQKELSRRFKFLNGLELRVYCGQVPCTMKHKEYELSLFPKENEYGKYTSLLTTIKKTRYNGKILTISVQEFDLSGYVRPFVVSPEDLLKAFRQEGAKFQGVIEIVQSVIDGRQNSKKP